MKKIDLYARSFTDIFEKLETAICEDLKVLSESDSEFGYIRLASNTVASIFIRMLPTLDYINKSETCYVNAYISYTEGSNRKEALFFSERYDSDTFDIIIQRLVSEICKIFNFSLDNISYKVQYISGTKTYKNVELESLYPNIIKDSKSFSNFLGILIKRLTIKNPTLTVIFQLNVAGITVSKDDPIYSNGSFFLSFTYNELLSDSYNEPIYIVGGEIPSLHTDVGREVIAEVLLEDELESYISSSTRWYFSIKNALTQGESVHCYIQEKPYFQKII